MEYDIYQIVSINAEGETVEVFAPEEIVAQVKASNTSIID
jgi:hypothetical protein